MLAAAAVLLLTGPMEARAADEVRHISGGASAEAREELRAQEPEFNLKIVVAEKSGDYLADVKIAIQSARKETVLEDKMLGPILLAKLPPGTYTIRAVYEDKELTQTVAVPARGLRQVDFRW
jgi:hypothetical protein